MDRDVALQINTALDSIKTGLQQLATYTTPTANNRSVSPDPEENKRSAPEAEPEAPEEEPEEEPEPVPETTTRKRTTSK